VTVSQESKLVEFDADTTVAAARETAGEGVHLAVEYTDEAFRTLYADDVTTSLYADDEQMREHFESVHDYVGIDFAEREVFRDAFRAAGGVRALTTHMDYTVIVRVLVDEMEGLLLSLDPDTNVTPVVRAVERAADASTADDTADASTADDTADESSADDTADESSAAAEAAESAPATESDGG
jgi:hypothetical protein